MVITEAVFRICSVKKLFKNFDKIHREVHAIDYFFK